MENEMLHRVVRLKNDLVDDRADQNAHILDCILTFMRHNPHLRFGQALIAMGLNQVGFYEESKETYVRLKATLTSLEQTHLS